MRVAIVTESFLPQVNGVTNTVRHVVDRLIQTGHEPLVVAPGPGLSDYRGASRGAGAVHGPARLQELPARPARPRGRAGARRVPPRRRPPRLPDRCSARSACAPPAGSTCPTVAVYQTDIAGFARQYGLRAEAAVARWVGRVHRRATRTLAPSRSSQAQLAAMGVPDVHLWRRGVSLDLFGPDRRRRELRRRSGDPAGRGRGRVRRPARRREAGAPARRARRPVPGVRLVVVGDGPERRLAGAARCRTPSSPGCCAATTWPAPSPRSTCSCTPGRPRRSARPCRRRRPAGSRSSRPPRAARSTWSDPGRTGLLYDPRDPAALAGRAVRHAGRRPGLRGRLATAALADVAEPHLGRRGRPARRPSTTAQVRPRPRRHAAGRLTRGAHRPAGQLRRPRLGRHEDRRRAPSGPATSRPARERLLVMPGPRDARDRHRRTATSSGCAPPGWAAATG